MLKKGGNAVDAAIATQWALAGCLSRRREYWWRFLVAQLKKSGKRIALDYREVAPAEAFRDMYLDEKGTLLQQKVRMVITLACRALLWDCLNLLNMQVADECF